MSSQDENGANCDVHNKKGGCSMHLKCNDCNPKGPQPVPPTQRCLGKLAASGFGPALALWRSMRPGTRLQHHPLGLQEIVQVPAVVVPSALSPLGRRCCVGRSLSLREQLRANNHDFDPYNTSVLHNDLPPHMYEKRDLEGSSRCPFRAPWKNI